MFSCRLVLHFLQDAIDIALQYVVRLYHNLNRVTLHVELLE